MGFIHFSKITLVISGTYGQLKKQRTTETTARYSFLMIHHRNNIDVTIDKIRNAPRPLAWQFIRCCVFLFLFRRRRIVDMVVAWPCLAWKSKVSFFLTSACFDLFWLCFQLHFGAKMLSHALPCLAWKWKVLYTFLTSDLAGSFFWLVLWLEQQQFYAMHGG